MSYKWNQSRGSYSNQQRQSGNQYNQNQTRFPPAGLKFLPNRSGAGILGAAPVGLLPHQQNHRNFNQNQQHHRRGGQGNRRSPARDRDRNKESKKRRRDSSHERQSPDGKRGASSDRQRSVPKYIIQYVKKTLNSERAAVQCLRTLHPRMYIPSDFINVDFIWQKSFSPKQPHTPRKSHFCIMSKEAQFLDQDQQIVLSPADTDHTWVAKVMLLSIPSIDDLYEKCCRLTGEQLKHFHHQTRLYKFLLGSKGKNELMAIGGAWSLSLDGPDPESNPRTLVNTAIRTCKALAGIDLSKCTSWRRMVEIQYHRDEEVRKGHTVPDRVETTVIFMPDVHSCMPIAEEYSDLRKHYLDTSEAVIKAAERELMEKSQPATDVTSEAQTTVTATDQHDQKAENEEAISLNASMDTDTSLTEQLDTGTTVSEKDVETINVKSLKVSELRKELDARGLSSRGLKGALIQRLTEALEDEAKAIKTNDGQGDSKDEVNEEKESESSDVKECSEQDTVGEHPGNKEENGGSDESETPKIDREKFVKMWTLPDEPQIPVHANPTYKKGGFDCVVTSLSTLLDYRPDDNKESIFEVSLFAESVRQMLQRDHALNIYKALCNPLPTFGNDDQKDCNDLEESELDKQEPACKKIKSDGDEVDESMGETTVDNACAGTKEHDKNGSGETATVDEKESTGKTEQAEVEDAQQSGVVVKKEDEKMVTLRKDLLLSFVFFDTTQCGYIKSNDMSDIIHSIGLGLSRSQIKKLLSSHLENDELKYRRLTDVPLRLVEKYTEHEESSAVSVLDILPAWNKDLLLKSLKHGDKKSKESDGMVTYNGTVIDVKALHTRLEKNEAAMASLEMNVQKLKCNLADVTNDLEKTKELKATLQAEHDKVNEKLTLVEKKLDSESTCRSQYEKTLRKLSNAIDEVLPKAEMPVAED